MSKERLKKHETTPRPNQWSRFRFKSINANKKSCQEINVSKKSDFKDIDDVVREKDDPFCSTSEESDSNHEESILDEDAWISTDGSLSSSETEEFSSPEKMRYQENILWEKEILSPIFPTNKEVQDLDEENGSPKLTSTKMGCSEDDLKLDIPVQSSTQTGVRNTYVQDLDEENGSPKLTSTKMGCNEDDLKLGVPVQSFAPTGVRNTCNEDDLKLGIPVQSSTHSGVGNTYVQDLEEENGNPKLSSAKTGCNEDDLQLDIPVHSSTETGMPPEYRENIVDSNNSQLENTSPIPVGINENYINIPDCQYLENGNSENTVAYIASEDLDVEPHIVLEGTKDKGHSLKHCQEKGGLDPVLLRGISFVTTINASDIVDGVFKNSNETSKPKFSDAFVTSEEIASEEHSQVAKEMNTREVPERPSVKEKTKKSQTFTRKKGRKTPKSFISERRITHITQNSQNEMKKKNSNRNDYSRYEEYLRTLPICPLSLSKTPNPGPERIEV